MNFIFVSGYTYSYLYSAIKSISLTEKVEIDDELEVHFPSSLDKMEVREGVCSLWSTSCLSPKLRTFRGTKLPRLYSSFLSPETSAPIKLIMELPQKDLRHQFVTHMELDYCESE